jgi:hypothetical protein
MQQMSALLLSGLYVLDLNAKDNCAQENMTLESGTMRTFMDKKGRWVPGEGHTRFR